MILSFSCIGRFRNGTYLFVLWDEAELLLKPERNACLECCHGDDVVVADGSGIVVVCVCVAIFARIPGCTKIGTRL